MRKRIMWFAILLLAICNKIAAEDRVYVSDFSISPGETREINVMLDNEDAYVGFQFDVYLPDGFTITSCSKSDRIPDGTTVLGNQRTDDTGSFYRVIGASLMGNAITGTSGAIATLTITADASVALNDYTGYLRTIKVSKTNGTGLTKDQETFTITVKSPEPYAALSSDNKTLTFYYDSQKQTRSGMSIGPFASGSNISWYSQRTSITTVVFDASFANYTNLTSTAYWFIGCHNLTTITGIANLKTDNVTSMVSMFSNCVNLHWVDVSGFNTSNVTDMSNMFMNCSKLEYVDVTHFNTAKVTNMSGMFYGCTDLSGLDVSGFDTGNVTTMKEMFRDCSSLSTLDISNFNTAKVTTMLGMFFGCSHLRALEFGNNFVTSKVQSMSMMFAGCKYLEALDLSNFDTSNVLGMYNMFESCWWLETLDLSSFNTANVLDMTAMFLDCANLETINLSSFNTAKVKNMVSMFKDCTSLTTITVSSEWNTASVTDNGEDMFSGCTELEGGSGTTYEASHINKEYARIDEGSTNPGYLTGPIPEPYAVLTDNNDDVTIDGTTVKGKTLTFYYDKKKGADGMSVGPFNNKDERSWNGVASTITSVVLDESFANCTTLTSTAYWFSLCSKLKTITGIDNLKTDNVTSMLWMFEGCSSLTSLDVSRFNTKKVSHMLGMFAGCSSLTSLDVSNFNTENVGDMEYLFSNCSNLTSIDLSNFKTDNVFDMSKMFYNCQSLTSLDLGNFKTDKVGKMFAMFYGCRRLESLDLSSFNTSNVGDMGSLFSECSALKKLNLSSFNTSNVWEMEGMFSGCSNLTNLDVSGFNTANVGDMNAMFYGCSGLTSLDVTNFNTANVTNMGWMFLGCSNLTSLDVTNFNTEKVTCMTSMFNDCSSLKKLDVTNFQTSNVTEMLAMFADCSSLSTIDLSNFNTSNVTDMRTMFDGCSGLTSLDVSSFNTEKVTGMSYMFGGCSGLTELDLTNFKTGNVTIMADMFSGCTKLKSIYIGSDWSTSAVTRGEEMFKNCSALVGGDGTTYDANHDDVSYAHIDGGISNPGYLTDTNNPRPEPYAVLSDNNTKLTFYYDKNKDANEGKSVGPFVYHEFQSWYDVREQITTVVFHESFANCTSITSTRYWFYDCNNLTTITGLENLNTVNVKDMQEMFSGCSNLTDLDVSHFNTVNVEDMALMFNDCSKLTLLDLSNFNTANVKSMSSMFEGCSGLTSLDLSSFETGNVTSMGGMFRKCGRIESLDLSSFNTAKVEYMQTMFSYCPSLRTLDLSSFNTANVKYMGYMFDHSTSLETIYVSDSWSTAKVTNGDYTFSNCDKLKGGKGTAYDSNKTDYTYAHIDGGPDNPGYLTEIVLEPYAVLTDNDDDVTIDGVPGKGKTLTFYYDSKKEDRGGMNVGPFLSMYSRNWNSNASSITSVVLDESFANCSSIESTAFWFSGCSHLTSIIGINNLKTDNVTGMRDMFATCSSLTNLDVSGFNTTNVTDMDGMFSGCSSLTSLDVSGFNTTNVTDMTSMFYGCSSLTSLDVSRFNTTNVTRMNSMFNHCSGLTSLDVSNFKNDNVTTMSSLFSGCSSLTSLNVSNFNTTNATNMGFMFKDCSNLSSLDVSNFKTDNATRMAGMFSGCSSLTSLDVSGFNTANVTNMNSMFHGCYSLTSLDVSGFNTTNVTTMSSLFSGCYSLTSLDVSRFNTTNVKNMEGMFSGCSGLTSLDVSGFNTTNVTDMTSMFYGCSSLTSLDVSGFKTDKVIDMESMFTACSGLTSLDLSSFNTSEVKYDADKYHFGIQNMFSDCSALTTIYVGEGWNVENLTECTYVFKDCTALVGGKGTTYDANHTDYTYAHIDGSTDNPGYLSEKRPEPYAVLTDNDDEITTDESTVKGKTLTFYYDTKKENRGGMDVGPFIFPDRRAWHDLRNRITTVIFNTSFANYTSLSSTKYWFNECSNLKTITDINNLKTENVTDMSYMFYRCSGLTSLDISGFNTENVTNMCYMFTSCSGLTNLDVSRFETGNVTDMGGFFYGCSGLKNLDVSNFNTDNVTNMRNMFDGCSGLTSLDVRNFNTENVTNMYRIFAGCSSLTSLDVSRFKTSNVTDMGWMFDDCSGVMNLDVSRFETGNVTNMGGMFNKCSGLKELDVSNFKMENVTQMWSMFKDCSSLTSLDVSHFNTSNATSMSSMFYGCSGLTSLDVSGFKTDKVTEMGFMFKACSSLTSLDVSGFKTEQVKSMEYMFDDCPRLTSLDVSGFNTEKVIGMSRMFNGCSSLTTLDVSNFKTGYVTEMYAMFAGCTSLTSLDMANFITDKVTNINGLFRHCSALTTIYVGDGWTTENLTEGGNVFNNCTALIGGQGTSYDANHTDYTYAHIDGGTSNPGYFTDKNKKNVTITAKSCSREYGEANPTFEYTVEGATLSGEPTITCEATATSPVGTYPIVVTYTAEDAAKMNLTFVNGTLTITKAPLTITAKSYTIKRGEAIPTLEVEYSGFKNNETDAVFTKKPTVSTEAKSDALAGTYDIVVSGAEAANYEIEYVNGTLTITDDVTVTAKNYSRVYGDENPTFEFTSEGATLSGTPTITCEATVTSPVGTYAIVIAKGSISNGTVTYVNGTLTITKAPLTITAKSCTIKQGKTLPEFELEYSGLKNKETDTVFTKKPTVSTVATSNSEPGTYDITVSGAEAKNYEMKYVKGTLTITERTETFDGIVLTVNEGGNMDDAFEIYGGKEEAAKTIAAIIWNASEKLTDKMLEGINNPNLLVYVSETSMAPESTKNVVIDGKAKSIELVDAEGNNNFFVPQEFTTENISYSRAFKQTTQDGISRGWEGIALPFNVQQFIHEEHGEISPFGDSTCDYHFWLRQPTNDGVINALSIEANKPYIISMPNSDEYEPEFNHPGLLKFTSTNVTVPVTKVESVWLGDSAQIVPTFQNIEASPDIYVLNVGDSIMDQTEGSIFISNYRSARPFEVYTFHEPRSNETNIFGSRIISLSSLFGGNGTTGVNDAMKTIEANGETWYDMNGRRLQGKPARKGVYIMNGKKVVIK